MQCQQLFFVKELKNRKIVNQNLLIYIKIKYSTKRHKKTVRGSGYSLITAFCSILHAGMQGLTPGICRPLRTARAFRRTPRRTPRPPEAWFRSADKSPPAAVRFPRCPSLPVPLTPARSAPAPQRKPSLQASVRKFRRISALFYFLPRSARRLRCTRLPPALPRRACRTPRRFMSTKRIFFA